VGCDELAPLSPAKTQGTPDPPRAFSRILETDAPAARRAPRPALDEGMHVVMWVPHRNRPSRSDSTTDVMRELVDVAAAHILIDGLYSTWMLIPHELLMLGGRNGQNEAAVVL
jgi:hypothetical protein